MVKDKLFTTFYISLAAALLIFSFSLVLNPGLRAHLNSIFESNQREILASLETNLLIPNKSFKILKIQDNKNLWIEIYDLNLSEKRIAQFKLTKKIDGQMFVNKKASSLFVSDLDGDQILEIIAPSFNSELHPKVHAFRYEPTTNSFSEISDQDLLQKLSI